MRVALSGRANANLREIARSIAFNEADDDRVLVIDIVNSIRTIVVFLTCSDEDLD